MNFTSVKKIHKTKVALNYEKIKRNLGHGRLLDKMKTIGDCKFNLSISQNAVNNSG